MLSLLIESASLWRRCHIASHRGVAVKITTFTAVPANSFAKIPDHARSKSSRTVFPLAMAGRIATSLPLVRSSISAACKRLNSQINQLFSCTFCTRISRQKCVASGQPAMPHQDKYSSFLAMAAAVIIWPRLSNPRRSSQYFKALP